MLLRSGGGASAKLSIPRDTLVTIPGHGVSKINASYAFGGAALTIETVKQFLGIEVNHVIEVNFENFPKLIDSHGRDRRQAGCVVSEINGGRRNGGQTLRLRRGTHHLSGDEALVLARTRKNKCRPGGGRPRPRAPPAADRLGDEVTRPLPRRLRAGPPSSPGRRREAIRTDMSGATLMSYLVGLGLSGNAPTHVLPATPTAERLADRLCRRPPGRRARPSRGRLGGGLGGALGRRRWASWAPTRRARRRPTTAWRRRTPDPPLAAPSLAERSSSRRAALSSRSRCCRSPCP